MFCKEIARINHVGVMWGVMYVYIYLLDIRLNPTPLDRCNLIMTDCHITTGS